MGKITRGLVSHSVKWNMLVPAHDGKSLFHKEYQGIVIEQEWMDQQLHCIVVDKAGVLYQKTATELTLVHSPSALPHDKFTQ